MSYDLDLVAPSPAGWGVVDVATIVDVLTAQPGAEQVADGVEWVLPGAAASITVVADGDGALREVGIAVTDGTDPGARRRDVRRVLDVLLCLADRVGGRVEDPQLGTVLDARTVGEAVASFAGPSLSRRRDA